MTTVNRRLPGTAYAFQDRPLGTGDAARKGAEIFERMRFEGDVLVVAGDKVIDPKVVRHLISAHEHSGADVTLATAKRPANSSAGILLKSARGNIVGILEEAERQRLAALGRINEAFGGKAKLPRATVEAIIAEECRERTARRVLDEVWGACGLKPAGSPKSEVRSPKSGGVLEREEFEARFSKEERLGLVKIGAETCSGRESSWTDLTR